MPKANRNSAKATETATHRDDLLWDWLGRYYRLLNNNVDFLDELKILFESFEAEQFRRGPLTQSEAGLGRSAPEGAPSRAMETAFATFARYWRLPERCWYLSPQRGIPDLYQSFSVWRGDGKVQLTGSSGVRTTYLKRRRITLKRRVFTYDPTIQTPAWAREKIEEKLRAIRQDALEQVQRLTQAASADAEFHGTHRSPTDRDLFVSRLYRHVVLKKKWVEIAEDDDVDYRSLLETSRKLAKLLGISLPGKRGRPRREM